MIRVEPYFLLVHFPLVIVLFFGAMILLMAAPFGQKLTHQGLIEPTIKAQMFEPGIPPFDHG